MSLPSTQKQWVISGQEGFDSLKFQTDAPIPKVGENEVLVKLEGASLNYRDLVILRVCEDREPVP